MDKQVKAAELKKMRVGTKVKLHRGSGDNHEWEEGKIVQSGRYKVLCFQDFLKGMYTRPITDVPGQYFTVEDVC